MLLPHGLQLYAILSRFTMISVDTQTWPLGLARCLDLISRKTLTIHIALSPSENFGDAGTVHFPAGLETMYISHLEEADVA